MKNEIYEVHISKNAYKTLKKLPTHIVARLRSWALSVEECGLYETRKLKGYHDEPLQGKRFGQRSVRLNRAYRAIYIVNKSGFIECVEVIEVNKHAY